MSPENDELLIVLGQTISIDSLLPPLSDKIVAPFLFGFRTRDLKQTYKRGISVVCVGEWAPLFFQPWGSISMSVSMKLLWGLECISVINLIFCHRDCGRGVCHYFLSTGEGT